MSIRTRCVLDQQDTAAMDNTEKAGSSLGRGRHVVGVLLMSLNGTLCSRAFTSSRALTVAPTAACSASTTLHRGTFHQHHSYSSSIKAEQSAAKEEVKRGVSVQPAQTSVTWAVQQCDGHGEVTIRLSPGNDDPHKLLSYMLDHLCSHRESWEDRSHNRAGWEEGSSHYFGQGLSMQNFPPPFCSCQCLSC